MFVYGEIGNIHGISVPNIPKLILFIMHEVSVFN